MKKKLNVDLIANELEGASLFFSRPANMQTPPEENKEANSTPLPSQVDPEKPTDGPLENPESLSPTPASEKSTTSQSGIENNQDQKRTFVRTYERSNERTDVRPKIKPKRQKIRHAFDIYEDQLRDLQLLQFRAVQKGKKKPKLGKMVQDAIDLYLKKKDSKTQ